MFDINIARLINQQDAVAQALQRKREAELKKRIEERDEEHDRFLKSIGQPTKKERVARAMAGFEVLLAELDKWIGTWLVEINSRMDMDLTGCGRYSTTKVQALELNDKYFMVEGEEFDCGGAAECLSIVAHTDQIVEFSGYGGHSFWITTIPPEKEEEDEEDEN